jgi:hypothetical protein
MLSRTVPVAELFAGLRERAGKEIAKRLPELRSRLQRETGKPSEARMITHKLRWFAERHGMATGDTPTTS